MDKLPFLGIWMSFSIAMAAGIRCYKCQYYYENMGCIRPKLPCRTHKHSSCFRETVFRGDIPVYTIMGCARNCKEIVENTQKILQVFSCCKSRDFCNI